MYRKKRYVIINVYKHGMFCSARSLLLDTLLISVKQLSVILLVVYMKLYCTAYNCTRTVLSQIKNALRYKKWENLITVVIFYSKNSTNQETQVNTGTFGDDYETK